jgi:single-strand DNA-binding protein
MNVVVLQGKLSRGPEERVLPSGAWLVAYEVTTRLDDGTASTAPVSWPSAPDGAALLDAGEEVVVVGHVRRRYFRAGGATQSRTEVVADTVLPVRQRSKVAKAIARAVADLSRPDRAG